MKTSSWIQVGLFLSFIVSMTFALLIYRPASYKVPQECWIITSLSERLLCLKPYFGQLTQKKGAASAVSKAKEFQKEGVIDDCHLAAHIIGNAQYNKFRDNVGEAFGSCSMGCTEGCFHGVMEAYISDPKHVSLSENNLMNVCDEIVDDTRMRRQCIHGIGHGLFRHNAAFIEDAFDKCKVFGDEADVCRGGVFMENMNNYLLLDESDLIKKLLSVCTKVEKMGNEEFTKSCYVAVGEGLMFYTGHDLMRSKSLCGEIRKDYVNVCVEAVERQLGTNERQIE